MSFDPDTDPVPYMEGTCGSPLEPDVVDALRNVYDPEIPVNVFDLGLIYDLDISDEGNANVVMTLTAPSCPVAEEIPVWIKQAIYGVEGIKEVDIELVWDPFWKPEYMTEAARLQLNLF